MNRKCLFVYDTDILAPFRVSKNKQTSCIIPNGFELKIIKTNDLAVSCVREKINDSEIRDLHSFKFMLKTLT